MSSKLDKSMIVAGAGLVASIFMMLVKKVREQGGTDEDIHRLATPDGEKILAKVAKVIVGKVRQVFKVWKTINLGTGLKSTNDFRKALGEAGLRISDWASDILGKPAFKAATEEQKIDLVVVSVAELGFKDSATRKEIYDAGLKFGLELCPAEVGPQLRLQYKYQPLGELLLIAMEPIAASDGDLMVFDVRHDDYGPWLGGRGGFPVAVWPPDRRWVFRLPRK